MKDLLQHVGVSKTQSRWNTVTQKRSHIQRQLASLKRHWSKRTGQSPYEGCSAIFVVKVRTQVVVTGVNYVRPKTVQEAKQGKEWDQWHWSIKDEVEALQDDETWHPVRSQTYRDAIQRNWLRKVKLRPSGPVDKHEARYLAKGFKQVE